MNRKSLFICGTGRCGTTLLAKILSQDKHILNMGETHLFHEWESFIRIVRRRILKGLTREGQPQAPNLISTSHIQDMLLTKAEGIKIISRHIGSLWMKPILMDKTPHNLERINLIEQLYENPHYIHILRNPLDVYASMKNHNSWGFTEPRAFITWYRKFMNTGLQQWNQVPEQRKRIIFLEEIVKNPAPLQELVSFLGIDQLNLSDINKDKAHILRYTYDLSPKEMGLVADHCTKHYEAWRKI